MRINLVADASVASAPSGFSAAIEAAAAVYEAAFPGAYTVNIRYGWGTFNNTADPSLANSHLSLGNALGLSLEDYATVKAWLSGDATLPDQLSAVASLPASPDLLPNQAPAIFVSAAQKKALGVFSGASGAIDGAIGFGTDSQNWEGLALTEIGHALGWLTSYYAGGPTVADLYRFGRPRPAAMERRSARLFLARWGRDRSRRLRDLVRLHAVHGSDRRSLLRTRRTRRPRSDEPRQRGAACD